MSPRRSSRARATQPPTNTNGSSSSSVASNRQERPARSNPEQDGQMKSATPQSSSAEPERSQPPEPETRQTRRQKREQGTLDEPNDRSIEDEVEEDDPDEEEVTRCICGQPEYPGPPVPLTAEAGRNSQPKDNHRATPQTVPEGLPEDAGSLFIQCDECHVWQHGGCVGIMDEATSPDNYYCEQCRSDLHRLMVGARGQKYSRYLPVYEAVNSKTPRRPSGLIPKEPFNRSSKEADLAGGTPTVAMSSAKRRSTMNSRAAVDEEEAFLKAIEESKSDGTTGNGARKTKRVRDESSDEIKQDLKRRKTASGSESPTPANAESAAALSDSETAASRVAMGNGRRRVRGLAGLTGRERDTREREKERERERAADVAGRRKGRTEIRRTDEPEPMEEVSRTAGPSRTQATAKQHRLQGSSRAPSAAALATSSTVQRKGLKPSAAARRGRVGRNQYTKERDAALESKGGSPQAPHSRDSEDIAQSEAHVGSATLVNGTKPAKPRHMNPNRTSMNDLRKRAAGILEYISRTQIDMAGEKTPPHQEESSPGPGSDGPKTRSGTNTAAAANGASKLSNQVDGPDEPAGEQGGDVERVDEAEFKDLSSLQMMDVLTRELVLWQKDYGKWGEK